MKKIKTACVDKLLALSSCLVITNCDKSAEDKKDGEKFRFYHLNTFVNISSDVSSFLERGKNIPEFNYKTLKDIIDKVLPGGFYNSCIPIQFRQLSPRDVIDCLTNINNSLGSGKSHDEIYSVLICCNAFIRCFGKFGLNNDTLIDFIGLVEELGEVCDALKNKNNLKREIIAWFTPNTTIPYGNIKQFFNDICIAFLCSKDVADLTFPNEHFLSKIERDTEKAGFLICCDQIESHTSEILKKVNDDMNDWKHSVSPNEDTLNYAGNTSGGTFSDVNLTKTNTIKTKNGILATIRDSNNTCFTCKNLDGSGNLTHNNPRSINTKDHINSIVAGLKEIEAVLTCYADKKKEIDRDKEDFKENFKKIDLDIERLLTALIYRGIQYNQFFVQSGNLEPLFHFTAQQKPLEGLNNALQGITEYTGQILKGILQNIFAKANEIKQVTDPHQGVVSIDLTALQNQIYDFNQKILNDRILFELAYNARRYLTDLFTGSTNAAFITAVPNKITTILQAHNENDYGNFLKGVCKFLSTWDDANNKDNNSEEPGDGTKWACKFKKFEFNKDNNPFIFEDGKDAAGFDFAFNDVQYILYEKYADCILPETFLECQQLFKRTRDICVTGEEGGLFNEIAKLHENTDFQDNTSLRSLDLLMICLPTNGETDDTFFNFFKRLPNTKNGEYINDAETWNIGKGNKDKEKIIGHINKIPDLVENRQKDKTCPKIDDAIGKLTNFILIDNPNEVIDICNYQGYREDFAEWKREYSLKYNVEYLNTNLTNLTGVLGKSYKTADDKITLTDFDFTSPKEMVAVCNKKDFGQNGNDFPALFADENNFDVKNYSQFHDNVFLIEDNLYYVLCCIKTLGASIPSRFLKKEDGNKNLLDSYRNCRNLSLLIENAITNVLIACVRYDTGWKMWGWNDRCKLHTQPEGKTHWGHYDIFYDGVGKYGDFAGIKEEGKEPDDDFSGHYSPFYSEIQRRDMYAQSWEQSFLNYKSTVTDGLPTSLQNLKCGFFNHALLRTLIWNKTDFNNYICIGNTEKHTNSPTPRALYCKYEEEDNPYSVEKYRPLRISYSKIIPNLPKSIPVVHSWNSTKDPCLLFNEKIAQNKIGIIPISDVLDAYYSSDFYIKGESSYLSLTHVNTRKGYEFKTFGSNTTFQYTEVDKHNFSELLNGVKECIDNFYEFYNDKEVFTSLQDVDFNDAKSKALLKLYLRNRLINDTHEYTSKFLNCFITPNEDLDNLKNYIIKVENKENRVKSFNNMTHRKQFYTEIYAVQDKNVVTTEKIDRYNEVFKLFNLEELQGGSVFVRNHSILDEEGRATHNSYSNFDQKLKGKVEDFFGKVHEKWCQKVMGYTTGDADKTLTEIFTGLGKTYDTLNTEVIDAVKNLKKNIDNVQNWFANKYNVGETSLKNLKDCVGKIGDDKTAKELQDFLETINPGNTTRNDQIDPANVKNKLDEVAKSLDDVIKNLPKADDNKLKSIFILKPNKGEDEIDNYKNYKDKLKENKKELDKYKTWLENYDRTILNELNTCFDSTKNLEIFQTTGGTINWYALKTLLGDDATFGSIKYKCKSLIDKLQDPNFNTSKNKLEEKLTTLPSYDKDLQQLEDRYDADEEGLDDTLNDDINKTFSSKKFQEIAQSLQDCIGDIDKILKEHLKAELNNVKKLLDETKTTLTFLDDLTKTDNSYMVTMKYISDNKDNKTKYIGKLWAGVNIDNNNGALEKVVNWKGELDEGKFYRNLVDIQNGLNDMLQTGGKNYFEPFAITISAADTEDGATYGDRIKVSKSTIITDDGLTQMAKDYLFNENVLNTCLKG